MEFYKGQEKDWKLFRKRVPLWQERYMEKLVEEYKELLNTEKPASEKFWTLEKRLKKDQKQSGVLITRISRSNMTDILCDLFLEKAITLSDLDGFSEDLQQYMKEWLDYVKEVKQRNRKK